MKDYLEEAKKNWWYILMIILVGGLGWWYLKNRVETEPLEVEEPVKLEQRIEAETVTVPSPEEAAAVLGQGGATEAALSPVQADSGMTATVKAKLAAEEGMYYVSLSGEGFAPPDKGYYYEAWLVNPAGQYFSIGRVAVTPEGQAALTIKTDGEKSEFTRLAVSLEPDDGDESPATVVLEGSLAATVAK